RPLLSSEECCVVGDSNQVARQEWSRSIFHRRSLVALVAVLLAYSWVAILFTYLVARFSATVAGAYSAMICIFAIAGFNGGAYALAKLDVVVRITGTHVEPQASDVVDVAGSRLSPEVSHGSVVTCLYLALADEDVWPYIDLLCLAAPPWSLERSLVKVIRLDAQNQLCSDIVDRSLRNGLAYRGACPSFRPYMEALSLNTGPTISDCCQIARTDAWKEWEPLNILSLDGYGVGMDVVVMLLEGMVLFCFLGWMDSGHGLTMMTGEGEADARTMDQDVELEKEKVEDLQARQAFLEHALVVRNLHKWHKRRHVVRGLYLALPPSECFGLLGVRGVGKTTTLEMIAGIVPMSSGEAYMQAVELPRNQRKWQTRVGFCPESGGLLDGLSPYDALRLFAGLRGVPGHRAQELVQSLLSFLELQQDAHRPTGLI
ncbi:hypothetical protein HPB47_022696, partial [Ixodes persulcatus]